MNRRATLALAAIAAVGVAGTAPALAAKPKPKPLRGTFSYTDVTPDPTVTANSDAASHCHGNVPASPADVNSQTLKVKGKGILTVVGHNALDWAMEVRDSKGLVLAGSDGGTPTDPEGTVVMLPKAGSYSVVYCNLEGEPTITASYKYVYK
ncbi:MAG TPA: hypothetical protein VFJ17_13535 [Mycobacteriales bacterium]|jgi:hypothetical protein|nr:hypothetical protein [Mycobacteriales bacterium]